MSQIKCSSCVFFTAPINVGDITCAVNPGGVASTCYDYTPEPIHVNTSLCRSLISLSVAFRRLKEFRANHPYAPVEFTVCQGEIRDKIKQIGLYGGLPQQVLRLSYRVMYE